MRINMRKYKKQELCNCIKTLVEAHQKLDSVGTEVRNVLLPQCQEMAIQIGTEIENAEGAHTTAVSYLEQYCEEVYLLSMAQSKSEWKQHQRNIQMLLKQTEQSIHNDIVDSPAEIVFLPYKASMWDALDSVYRAAVQEQNGNVTVIPIPYYNINSEGEVLAVEYEGALFPQDIPITDFRDYDLAKMHPDVIFIHNPYDEYNRVTQVPQEYFSSTLINYTEHLVYIPYFVARGTEVKVDYCVMPAVRNAWRTFVQSETVREDYIEAGNDAERIVALGSPKFDMVIKMQENPPAMPEEWKSALEGRKIFLLNTHLNPIINEAEKTIDKLQQIFALFAEREDVALLWRPHPLSIQTAKSMNPRILDDYMKLIEEFKKIPNGVYDDSADVHRAIAISDAYIGNRSSLVTLYGLTGKPMYLLAVQCEHKIRIPERMKYLQFSYGIMHNNELWFPADNYNGLYKMDMDTKKIEFIADFDKDGTNLKKLYYRMFLHNDNLYLIPNRADSIAIYHMKRKEMEYIPLEFGEASDHIFYSAVQYENYIYVFPARGDAIVRLDLRDNTVEYFSDCCQDIKKDGTYLGLFGGAYQTANKYWITTPNVNCIIEFDLSNGLYQKHYLRESIHGTSDITGDDKYLYVLNFAGEVWQIDRETLEETLIWRYQGEHTIGAYNSIVYANHNVWLMPARENKMLKIDVRKQNAVEEKEFPDIYTMYSGKDMISKTGGYLVHDNKIIIYPASSKTMLTYDIVNDSWSDISLPVNRTCMINYAEHENCFLKKANIYSEHWTETEKFLNYVVSDIEMGIAERKEFFVQQQLNADGTCGEKIWQYIFRVLHREENNPNA